MRSEKIQNFAGVIIHNREEEILLVKKLEQYAYAIPWCRIVPGIPLQQCLRERVRDLTGLSVQPVFLGPSEHIYGDSHFISFDHTASIDVRQHQFNQSGLDYLWAKPEGLRGLPLVPLTRQILESYFLSRGMELELSTEPKMLCMGE